MEKRQIVKAKRKGERDPRKIIAGDEKKKENDKKKKRKAEVEPAYYQKEGTNFWFRLLPAPSQDEKKRRYVKETEGQEIINCIETLDGQPGPAVAKLNTYYIFSDGVIRGCDYSSDGSFTTHGDTMKFEWSEEPFASEFNPERKHTPTPRPDLTGVFTKTPITPETYRQQWGLEDVKTNMAQDERFNKHVHAMIQSVQKFGHFFWDDHRSGSDEKRRLEEVIVVIREKQDTETGKWELVHTQYEDDIDHIDDRIWITHGSTGCKNPLYVNKKHEEKVHLSRWSHGSQLHNQADDLHEKRFLVQTMAPGTYLDYAMREVNIKLKVEDFVKLGSGTGAG